VQLGSDQEEKAEEASEEEEI
jgi:hypothetical protein